MNSYGKERTLLCVVATTLCCGMATGCYGEEDAAFLAGDEAEVSATQQALNRNVTLITSPSSAITGLNYNPNRQVDFDEDGAVDTVSCDKSKIRVQSGDGGADLYNWTRDYGDDGNWKLQIPNCEVVKMYLQSDGKWRYGIVEAAHYYNTATGQRKGVKQMVVLYTGTSWVTYRVRLDGSDYKPVARSVECTKYPDGVLDTYNEFSDGALCFFSSYQDDLVGTPHTALVKIEYTGSGWSFRDLTASSDLPWRGWNGGGGTPDSDFRRYTHCDGIGRRDGKHLMDSAFLDYDDNGTPDLVTVGQHASVRVHKMVRDYSRWQNIRFVTTVIHQANEGAMSEFLTVESFRDMDSSVDSPCVWVSGDKQPSEACGKVLDHPWCWDGDSWEKVDMPVSFTSDIFGANIRKHPTNSARVVVKATKVNTNDCAWVPWACDRSTLYFGMDEP